MFSKILLFLFRLLIQGRRCHRTFVRSFAGCPDAVCQAVEREARFRWLFGAKHCCESVVKHSRLSEQPQTKTCDTAEFVVLTLLEMSLLRRYVDAQTEPFAVIQARAVHI